MRVRGKLAIETGPPLLERESSLALLSEYAAQAAGGEGRLVLLSGEAGVGKSALVERLCRDLPDARWSWSMCDGLFTPRPLGPLFDLADQLGGALLDRCRAGAGREELFRTLLAQVRASGGLDVVVVEDVHWADEATLDLLRYLSRRLRGAALLLIATYRDDGLAVGDQLRVTLGDLGSQRCTRRVGLVPLSPEAVRTLAGGSGPPAPELYRLTGGNPFYVTEVLRAGMDEVPPSARDAVLARAARLSAEAREVLDVAALTGARVEARLLESVTGCPPSVLDELLESGLLVGDGAWVRFRHEIARLAVAHAVAGHRGQVIHGLVLAALRSLGCDDDARMAFHAEAAVDGAAVLRYAASAARRAARLASHREAAAQYERALRFSGGADPVTLAGLHEGLADEVALLDRWDDAETAGERALALWREAGDRLREGDALRRLSRIRWNMCRGREAVAAAEAAVSALEPLGPSVELARAYATFANQRMLYADYDVAIDLARRAQALAVRFGATDVHSDALRHPGRQPFGQGPGLGRPDAPRARHRAGRGAPSRGRARLHQPVRNPRGQAGVRRGRAVPGAWHRVLRRARHHHVRDLPARRARERAGTHRSLGRGRRAEQRDPDQGRPVPGEPALLADPARRDRSPAGRARGLGVP